MDDPTPINVLAIHGISDVAPGEFARSVAETLGDEVYAETNGTFRVVHEGKTYVVHDGWWADLSPRPTSTLGALLASVEALWSFMVVARLELRQLTPSRIREVLFEASAACVGVVLPALLVAFGVALVLFRTAFESATAGVALVTTLAALGAWAALLVATRTWRHTGLMQVGGTLLVAAAVYVSPGAHPLIAALLPLIAAGSAVYGFVRLQAVPPPDAAGWLSGLAVGAVLGRNLSEPLKGLIRRDSLTEVAHQMVRCVEEGLELAAAGAVVLPIFGLVAVIEAYRSSAERRRSLRTLVLVPTVGLLVLWTGGIVALELLAPDDDGLPPGWVETTCSPASEPQEAGIAADGSGTGPLAACRDSSASATWHVAREGDALRGKCEPGPPLRPQSSYPLSLKTAPLGDTDRSLHLVFSFSLLLVAAFVMVHHLPAVLRESLPDGPLRRWLPDQEHVAQTLTDARAGGPGIVAAVSVVLAAGFASFGVLSIVPEAPWYALTGWCPRDVRDGLANDLARGLEPFGWVGSLLVAGQALVAWLIPLVADLARDTFRVLIPDDKGAGNGDGRSAIQRRVDHHVHRVKPDVIVAHSQGTLLALRTGPGVPKVFFGSPIVAFYSQLTPALLGSVELGRVHNLYSPTDYVGRALTPGLGEARGPEEEVPMVEVEGHTRYFDAAHRKLVGEALRKAVRTVVRCPPPSTRPPPATSTS